MAIFRHSTTAAAARCAATVAEEPPLSPDALDLMRMVLGGSLSAALALPPSPATSEVEHLATAAMEHHLERRLRTTGAYS